MQRSPDDGVGMEDLDKLQMELEMLLSNVVLRQRTLHSEIALITSAEENKPKKTASLSLAKNVCYIVSSFKVKITIKFLKFYY